MHQAGKLVFIRAAGFGDPTGVAGVLLLMICESLYRLGLLIFSVMALLVCIKLARCGPRVTGILLQFEASNSKACNPQLGALVFFSVTPPVAHA